MDPNRLYPPELVGGTPIASSGPKDEAAVTANSWAEHILPALARRVRVPVHFSVGDHERIWRNDPQGLAEVVSRFTAAPRAVLNPQFESGHNLSLGYTATAYHLKVLSFVEECIATRANEE